MNTPALPTLDDLVHRSELELDWPLLLGQIARQAVSAAAMRSIGAWQPEPTHESACERMRLSAQALESVPEWALVARRELP